MLTAIIPHTHKAAAYAKQLRLNQTYVEKKLWQKLRGKRFLDSKFRRQVPLGPYIVDFLCVQHHLVIEVDGNSHWQPGARQYDKIREEYLESYGFKIIRFNNSEVLFDIENVLERIGDVLLTPTPSLPCGEGVLTPRYA